MISRDEIRVSTLRLLLSEIKNAEIAKQSLPSEEGKGGEMPDEDIISVIQREVKKRKEAAAGFRSGEREESALKEESELKILQEYLPAQMQLEELTKLIEQTITEVGASSISDMGKVIGAVMNKVKGRADGGVVSSIVKTKLS